MTLQIPLSQIGGDPAAFHVRVADCIRSRAVYCIRRLT